MSQLYLKTFLHPEEKIDEESWNQVCNSFSERCCCSQQCKPDGLFKRGLEVPLIRHMGT